MSSGSVDRGGDNITEEQVGQPLTYPVEAFISQEYLQLEKENLWPKIWQVAGRLEEIPKVGSFITYDIAGDSVIIVRTSKTELKAYHNVCPHRGRRLIDTPHGKNHACGERDRFVCGFHRWSFGLDGENIYVHDKQDWCGALDDPARTKLSEVKVDTWGGWVWICLDENAVPLMEYLGDAARILAPFQFDKMRYKWRQWVIFDCNWKTALEAFMEPYHVAGTHTQMLKHGDYYAYSAAYGLHGVSGFDQRDPELQMKQSSTITRAGLGRDPRISTYNLQHEIYTTVNNASTTETLVNAAKRLVDELPEGTPADEVIRHWLSSARRDDAERGVIWPEITPDQMAEAGLAWHVFPNTSILQGITFALCYRTRPYGDDPDKCIFESYAIERFPEGEEPETEWVYAEATAEKWGLVLSQDFSNMEAVQKGMHSRGFRGAQPNPHQEQKITNFHRNLAELMKTGYPELLAKK